MVQRFWRLGFVCQTGDHRARVYLNTKGLTPGSDMVKDPGVESGRGSTWFQLCDSNHLRLCHARNKALVEWDMTMSAKTSQALPQLTAWQSLAAMETN